MLTFKSLTEQLTSQRTDGKTLVDLSMRTDTVFCQSAVSQGYLTNGQMLRAAKRYQLGKSKDGAVVFWEIDEEQRIRDGKLMWYGEDCHRLKDHNPTWVTACLKNQGELPTMFEPQRCLFGLHLLPSALNHHPSALTPQPSTIKHQPSTICIVEAEKTAVICSELFPQYLWMAPGGLSMFSAAKLYPLRDHKVVVFPDTDPDGKTYKEWKKICDTAQDSFRYPLRVSPILENHATPDQKRRKIDIVDFLFETEEKLT